MSAAPTQTTKIEQGQEPAKENLPAISQPRILWHPAVEERFGINRTAWKALVEAIFPNAQTFESIILALSYCQARKLDPFKRNVHIVPIWDKARACLVDTIWPGIGELRTTAFRTGEYAGRAETVFGPTITRTVGKVEMTFPEWAQVTVQRVVKGATRTFAGPKVYWLETYAVRRRDDDSPNDMWETRPFGQLDKCAEAAALRVGFPEEIGSDYTNDEIGRGTVSAAHVEPVSIGQLKPGRSSFNGRRDEVPSNTAPAAQEAPVLEAPPADEPPTPEVQERKQKIVEQGEELKRRPDVGAAVAAANNPDTLPGFGPTTRGRKL